MCGNEILARGYQEYIKLLINSIINSAESCKFYEIADLLKLPQDFIKYFVTSVAKSQIEDIADNRNKKVYAWIIDDTMITSELYITKLEFMIKGLLS